MCMFPPQNVPLLRHNQSMHVDVFLWRLSKPCCKNCVKQKRRMYTHPYCDWTACWGVCWSCRKEYKFLTCGFIVTKKKTVTQPCFGSSAWLTGRKLFSYKFFIHKHSSIKEHSVGVRWAIPFRDIVNLAKFCVSVLSTPAHAADSIYDTHRNTDACILWQIWCRFPLNVLNAIAQEFFEVSLSW